ncbi:HsdM family class I SAM-dependent methyltransferase [Ancrocorticia populi]|uniref:HsdM family class I SAM-dependent methyltransferase n=1 Tax=Ancrocorticia populi TaxID=2175228 RepID=UPI003F9265FF
MSSEVTDTSKRKARGAFFTPAPVAGFMVSWAVRDSRDQVLDPSCGDAAFLVPAVRRLAELGATSPTVHGVEIHGQTAKQAESLVGEAGGCGLIETRDFFNFGTTEAGPFDAVVGNPPYIRYQGFSGTARAAALRASLQAGVNLSALSSSWAPFVVHASRFLRPGGRLAFVLPAELLSVNYAGPIRRFLLENFGDVQLTLFEHQVFPEAQADVVLLLADRFGGHTESAKVRQVRDEWALQEGAAEDDDAPTAWSPHTPAEKWTDLFLSPAAADVVSRGRDVGAFASLDTWGRTRLGAVTGSNKYFTLSPAKVQELGISRRDLVRISPPGSKHLRGLALTSAKIAELGESGKAVWLFRPSSQPSPGAMAYIGHGHDLGIDQAYKCRVRTPWYQVPVLPAPDLFLTCMNADTPRLTTNSAGVLHLNSVHGVYLEEGLQLLGRELLPLASLNSLTLLNAETTGRSYGGGILKIEPREADRWMMPSPQLVQRHSAELRKIKRSVLAKLNRGKLLEAVEQVDGVLLAGLFSPEEIGAIRSARQRISDRRIMRGRHNGRTNGIHQDAGMEVLRSDR